MSKKISYKDALKELEGIIQQIENDEPDIDELGELVKKAASLIKQCKTKLKGTEQKLNDTLEELE